MFFVNSADAQFAPAKSKDPVQADFDKFVGRWTVKFSGHQEVWEVSDNRNAKRIDDDSKSAGVVRPAADGFFEINFKHELTRIKVIDETRILVERWNPKEKYRQKLPATNSGTGAKLVE